MRRALKVEKTLKSQTTKRAIMRRRLCQGSWMMMTAMWQLAMQLALKVMRMSQKKQMMMMNQMSLKKSRQTQVEGIPGMWQMLKL